MSEKTFGEMDPDKIYYDRASALGIGFDADGKIPVIRTKLYNGGTGYFLLGGGIEENEDHRDCIVRECLEEAGLSVTPKDFICKGEHYHYIKETETDFHGTGYFYFMQINGVVAKPTEPGHTLVWLTVEESKEKLFLPHQIWAVEQVYKFYMNKIT